jgi:hypothetical protein
LPDWCDSAQHRIIARPSRRSPLLWRQNETIDAITADMAKNRPS